MLREKGTQLYFSVLKNVSKLLIKIMNENLLREKGRLKYGLIYLEKSHDSLWRYAIVRFRRDR